MYRLTVKNMSVVILNIHLNRMAYVTHEDICKCFQGDTMLTIQAPTGTQLEVPVPDSVSCILIVLVV